MRILHIITKLNNMYGAQRHAVESIKNHLFNHHSCMVITGEVGLASDIVAGLGVPIEHITSLKNSYNPITGYKATIPIIKILESFKPDLVISHSTIAGIISRIACYHKKVPNIFTVQGWPFEIGTKLHQRYIALILERILKKYSDSYQCVSQYTADYGIKTLQIKNASRVYVCGNMHLKQENIERVSFQLSNNLLMVAGFRDQKDHLTAIKAFEIVSRSNSLPNLKMTFVGDGPNREKIMSQIKERGLDERIIIAGETKEVDRYYDNADVVILPTFYEGLPLSLIEAIQKGKPVVATNVGGIKEIVQDNVNGNLIQVGDFLALANHIIEYYTNNRIEKLSDGSKFVYSEYYSYDKISKCLNDIIHDAARNTIFKQN